MCDIFFKFAISAIVVFDLCLQIHYNENTVGHHRRRKGSVVGGGTMASAEHEPITVFWGQSPQRGPGAEPLVRGSGGGSPP